MHISFWKKATHHAIEKIGNAAIIFILQTAQS